MEEFELEPGETVTTEVRQHMVVLFLRLLPFAALALLPVIVAPIIASFAHLSHGQVPAFEISSTFRFLFAIWLLFLWMGAFTVITRYFLTLWVITTHRIVDISQDGFFRRRVSSFLLARVQDVTTDVSGVLGTLIGWGEIHVETAGRDDTFFMRGIRDPEGIRDLIMREVAVLHQGDTTSGT